MAKRKTFSIKDIARESGASLTTVSFVLNGRDHRISEATRRRVLDTANRLGYRPSRLAQGLQSRRTRMLAILVPPLHHTFADVYFGELISAVHDHATRTGYRILLEVAHGDFLKTRQHLELFDRAFVDGMLGIGVTNRDTYLSDFEDGERPLVVVNNHLPDLKLNFVRSDYAQAGRMAAQYLIGLGHRRIGHIRGATEVQTTWDFRAGAETALREAGLDLPDTRVVDGLLTEEGGEAAAVELLRRDAGVTAILAGNDKMAIGAIAGIKHTGRRVPADVSVVGCDDLHHAAFSDPPLTTVHTPLYEVGRQACQRLLELVNGEVEQVADVQPVSLTIRESAAPVSTTPGAKPKRTSAR